MESLNPDTGLKNMPEVDNLSTEFGKLSLAEVQQSTNQVLDHTKTKRSVKNNLLTLYDRRDLNIMAAMGFKTSDQDLSYIDKHLIYLNHNMYKSSLKCRVSNSPKTLHESTMHLVAFQTFIIDHGKFLAGCEQWSDVLRYFFIAWKHISNMPTESSIMHVRVRSDGLCLLLRLFLIAFIKLKNTLSKEKKRFYLKDFMFQCYTSRDEIVKKLQQEFFKFIDFTEFI